MNLPDIIAYIYTDRRIPHHHRRPPPRSVVYYFKRNYRFLFIFYSIFRVASLFNEKLIKTDNHDLRKTVFRHPTVFGFRTIGIVCLHDKIDVIYHRLNRNS